jgi:hypothetical protein
MRWAKSQIEHLENVYSHWSTPSTLICHQYGGANTETTEKFAELNYEVIAMIE